MSILPRDDTRRDDLQGLPDLPETIDLGKLMKYALDLVTFGDYANPKNVVPLAQAALDSGWDGFFVWDHLAFAWGVPSGDPWVILAAVSQAAPGLHIGPMITPLPRRRPQVLANAAATLDQLSGGRLILGLGLGGAEREFGAFGEEADASVRARQLDEGLDVLNRLFSGESVHHQGRYYSFQDVRLAPLPVQRPRPPIWIGGESRPAMRRAARWDGWVVGGDNQEGQMIVSPEQIDEKLAYLNAHRAGGGPFDIALTGVSKPSDGRMVGEFAGAGVTWWLESIHGFLGDSEALLARIKAGPPT